MFRIKKNGNVMYVSVYAISFALCRKDEIPKKQASIQCIFAIIVNIILLLSRTERAIVIAAAYASMNDKNNRAV